MTRAHFCSTDPNVKFTSSQPILPVAPGIDSSVEQFIVKVGTNKETKFGVAFRWNRPIKKLDLDFNKYK